MKNSLNSPTALERLYRNRFDGHAEYRMRVWKILAGRFFSQYVASDATVLDLGCGHGEFINNIHCGKKFAMDLNAGVRQRLDSDVIFVEQDCSQRWEIADATLDVIFSSNFFEHVPSKQALSDIIAEAGRCIRSGGRLIAMGPNIRFVGSAYWDFWDHHLPLTESSVAELLEMHGFRIERSLDRFLPYTMVNKRAVPAAFIALYLMLPAMWKIFGKQFLIIAAKP